MNVRKLVFDAVDLLRGSPVRESFSELESSFPGCPQERSKRLNAILEHATKTTEHYRKFAGIKELADFPVLNKSIIKNNFDSFVSENFKEKLTKLRKATTSGSYGTPFTFYLSNEKRQRMVAEVYYFGKSSGFELGVKHAYLVSKRKPKLAQFIQNQVMVTVDRLDDAWCSEAVSLLRKERVKVLVGYPSAIARIARYLLQRNERLEMRGVITISEVLTAEMRSDIALAFDRKPVSRYSTEEFGVLANQDPSGDFFWVNQHNYVIEILSLESDQPVEVGELGRIVVTDLYSHVMPLIRYDIGDLARPLEMVDGVVTKIEAVEGRTLASIRDVQGAYISPFVINGSLRESSEIVQFQFSQEGIDRYLLKLVVNAEVDEQKLINLYKSILGDSATVQIEYVDDIPPLPSGKRPYIIQNFY